MGSLYKWQVVKYVVNKLQVSGFFGRPVIIYVFKLLTFNKFYFSQRVAYFAYWQ